MAIKDIWESRQTLYTIYSGKVTGEDLVASSLEKSGDARFDDIRFIIADWLQATDIEISPEDVKHLVACLRSISRLCPNAKNASIVNRDETGNSLVAWYKYLADDLSWDIGIFHSEEEAREWCKNQP